ncbi:hypothetical protein C2S52_018701 [Perilla frutescens var. hirtella]|nr:hypothetical protein C2S52_018701 [Perilla frutescens var. hirtella]
MIKPIENQTTNEYPTNTPDELTIQLANFLKNSLKLQSSQNTNTESLSIGFKLNKDKYLLWAILMKKEIGGRGKAAYLMGDPSTTSDPTYKSDEDESHYVIKSSKKTPITRSSKKSLLSGSRRSPLASVGNRELRDLSKFAKGLVKLDLLKDNSRAKKKSKKEVKRVDLISSRVEKKVEKDYRSEFTSEGELLDKDDVCYDAKPLQVVEAGALLEKSCLDVKGQVASLKDSLMAEIGLERSFGVGELNDTGSGLHESRVDGFLSKNLDVSEKEDDRRLSEMEFNRFLSEDNVGDRVLEDSDFVFNREFDRADSFRYVNPSTFIQSPLDTINMGIPMLDGKLNQGAIKNGVFSNLPFLDKAASLPLVIENPNSQNPSCINPTHEPSESSTPSKHNQARPLPSIKQPDPVPINPELVSRVLTPQLARSVSLSNINQLQPYQTCAESSTFVNPILTKSLSKGLVVLSCEPTGPSSDLNTSVNRVEFPAQLQINSLNGPHQQFNSELSIGNNFVQPNLDNHAGKISHRVSEASLSMDINFCDELMQESGNNTWDVFKKIDGDGVKDNNCMNGVGENLSENREVSMRFLDALRAPSRHNGPIMFNSSTIKDIGPIEVRDGTPVLLFNSNDHDFLAGRMGLALVGKFSHAIPSPANIEKALRNIQISGAHELPIWFVNGCPMRVFKWTPGFNPSFETSIFAIWITLPGLPLHLFDHNALFKIGSIFGNPIQIENATANRTRVSFAKFRRQTHRAVEENISNVGSRFQVLSEEGVQSNVQQYEEPSNDNQRDLAGSRVAMEELKSPGIKSSTNCDRQQPYLEHEDILGPDNQIRATGGSNIVAESGQHVDIVGNRENNLVDTSGGLNERWGFFVGSVLKIGDRDRATMNSGNHKRDGGEISPSRLAIENGRVRSHARVFDVGGGSTDFDNSRLSRSRQHTDLDSPKEGDCHNADLNKDNIDAVVCNVPSHEAISSPMQMSPIVHGLGSKAKCGYLHNLIRLHRLSILVIIEPKVRFDPDFFSRCFGLTLVASNLSNHIWIFCARDFTVAVDLDFSQLLHVRVDSPLLSRTVYLSLVYGRHSREDRFELWDQLRDIALGIDGSPWLVGGDFNIFLTQDEVENGVSDRHREMMDFGDAISDCQLLDPGFDGAWYTWERPSTGLRERLDRVLLGEFLTSVFAVTRVTHLSRHTLDHASLLVRCQFLDQIPKSSFRFQNMWIRHHTFRDTVIQEWIAPTDIFARVRQADADVAVAQASYDSSPTPDARAELSRCVAEYVLRTRMEEDFLKQKAAVRWVTEGEWNSRFFQGWVKPRRCQSRIHSIEDDGRVIEDDNWIRASAAGFFQRLLTSDIDQLGDPDFSCLHRIPTDMDTDGLCRNPDIDEIRSAVFGISGDSVSGPDGFTSLFFQHCWDIVSSDVVGAVVDFFAGAHMPRSFTATTIIFLPKKETPSGFVKGRLLSDNILLTQEMIRDLHISRDVSNVALKLDMAKAYDRVQWSFLLAVLRHMGFPDQLGDPLSPSLFVLAADYLSRILDRLICGDPVMRYRTAKKGFPVSHLSYADDIIIFTRADPDGLGRLVDCLEHYFLVSGQLVNRGKSNFYIMEKFVPTWHHQIQSVFGYQRGSLPFTYLGVPIYRGFLKCSLFIPLRQRLSDRIHSWSHKHLSFGGRLALIRSTLATIPLHIFQVMEPPQGILHQLEQMLARFFWDSVGEKRKMHWISWETICLPVSDGGLGIRRFGDLVTAFSWKPWWRFRARDSLWARYMWAKYCRGCLYPLRMPLVPYDSRVWKRVVRVGAWAQDHIRWSLGNGQVSFWDDIWCDDVSLSSYCPASHFDHLHVDWYLSGESWYVECLHALHEHFALPVDLIDSVIWTPVMWGERDSMRLQSRPIHLASRCQCCVDPHVESIEDVFLWSESAKSVWAYVANWFYITAPRAYTVAHAFGFWRGLFPWSVPKHIRFLISCLAFWFIWTEMNSRKHRDIPFLVSHIVWQNGVVVASGGTLGEAQHGWIFFDGSTDGGWWGGLIRDYTRSMLAGFCAPLRAASSFDAEFQALLHGLRLAVQYSDHVWIEMDAASVVSALQSGCQGSAVTRHTLTSIRLLCRGRYVRFTHIPREGNRAADFLTGRGAQTSVLTFYDDVSAPTYLLSLVRMDLLGYPNFRFRDMFTFGTYPAHDIVRDVALFIHRLGMVPNAPPLGAHKK